MCRGGIFRVDQVRGRDDSVAIAGNFDRQQVAEARISTEIGQRPGGGPLGQQVKDNVVILEVTARAGICTVAALLDHISKTRPPALTGQGSGL